MPRFLDRGDLSVVASGAEEEQPPHRPGPFPGRDQWTNILGAVKNGDQYGWVWVQRGPVPTDPDSWPADRIFQEKA